MRPWDVVVHVSSRGGRPKGPAADDARRAEGRTEGRGAGLWRGVARRGRCGRLVARGPSRWRPVVAAGLWRPSPRGRIGSPRPRRPTAQRRSPVVTPIDPTVGGVPARREPQPADARRRAAALREAGGRRARLRPRDVRGRCVDVDEIAPLFLKHPHRSLRTGRPAGLERGRAVRHRAPRPAQRAAEARPGPRAARARARGCTAPGSPGSGRCGRRTSSRGSPTAGSRCTPRSTTPWSTASRRCGCCSERARTDPDERGMPAPWAKRDRAAPRSTASPEPRPSASLAEVPVDALRTALGVTAEAAGHAGRADQDAHQGHAQRDVGAVALRAAHDVQPEHHRRPAASPPRTGRSSGCAAIGKATGTTINDVVLAMCSGAIRTYLHRARRAAGHSAGRDGPGRPQRQGVAPRLGRGRQRGRRGDGPARHRPGRPGRPARGDPPVDEGRQGRARRR